MGQKKSGQRDSNPRLPAWEAGTLPLSYARSVPADSSSASDPYFTACRFCFQLCERVLKHGFLLDIHWKAWSNKPTQLKEGVMKRLCCVIPLVFLLCFPFGCKQGGGMVGGPTADAEEEKEAIKAWFNQYVINVKAGNVNGLLALYVENIVILPPNGTTVQGQDAFQKWLIGWFEEYDAEETLEIQEIEVFGKNGFARGTHNYRNIHKKRRDTKEGKGTFINLFEMQPDGIWKCTHNMWTSVSLLSSEEE
jgi:ketosteroid isomerase-like protein